MNQQNLNRLKAAADGKVVGYHRLEGVTIRVTSSGFLVDEVDAWRDGDPAPAYQGRVEPSGPGRWRAMIATGKPENKTDVMRKHSAGLDYVSALAIVVSHRSQRPVKRPWDDDQAAAAARTASDGSAEGGDLSEAVIVLPHSGLRVPHAGLTVTSLRQVAMSGGVAYTATLRLNGKIVGTIENAGRGGETRFEPRPGTGFGHDDLTAYARNCRTVGGWDSTESVLDDLVDEYETARIVAKNANASKITYRLQRRVADDSTDTYTTDYAALKAQRAPRTSKEEAELGESCHRLIPAESGRSWWQVWDADAQRWIDLPGTPAAQAGSEAAA